MLAALAGNDDCPGRAIPEGNYTAAAPYLDSGDTTGANDTVTSPRSSFYCYYSYNANGPDHVYSFTLTGRGPNPQIQVSTTSSLYVPLIYVLRGDLPGACPAGSGTSPCSLIVISPSPIGGTATLKSQHIDFLPLNVPLHLFVDSTLSGQNGAGPYTLRMQDVSIGPRATCPNPMDCPDSFVHQHYSDFLNRNADAGGLSYWTNEITLCGADPGCIEVKRINVSAAFFLSIEFQETGYLVYRMYKSSYGNLPGAPVPINLAEFLSDTQTIGNGVVVNQTGWEQVLENNKQAFAFRFVTRSRFISAYATSMPPAQFVDALFANSGVTPSASDRAAAINEFGSAANTDDFAARARALRGVAENSILKQQEFNRAFVLMQYFGYLRRNPNDAPDGNFAGYDSWLSKLNNFNGNFVQAEMVKAFLDSIEYRKRFVP